MNTISYRYNFSIVIGLILSLCVVGLVDAKQTLPKHYPTQFDLDGYVDKVDIPKQVIYVSGYPLKMNLETTAYDLKGNKTSLLNLKNRAKVGVQLFPYVKGQERVANKIWVLPPNYKLNYKPM